MPKVKIYMTRTCGYCQMALRLLAKKGIEPERILVDKHPERRKEMTEITGRWTVPQVFIGDRHVGGYDDLIELDMDGELDPLLSGTDAA